MDRKFGIQVTRVLADDVKLKIRWLGYWICDGRGDPLEVDNPLELIERLERFNSENEHRYVYEIKQRPEGGRRRGT